MVSCAADKAMSSAQIVWRYAMGLALCGLCACTTAQQMREGLRPKPLISPEAQDKAEVYSEIAAAQKQRSEAFVQIIGGDLELPPTAGQNAPSETRKYSIDVWFDDSLIDNDTVENAIKDGRLIVEILGSEARINPVEYTQTKNDLTSKHVIRIEVDSRDISQSFTIIAKAVRHADKWQKSHKNALDSLASMLTEASERCSKSCREYLDARRESITAHGSRAIDPSSANGQAALKYLATGEAYEREQLAQNPYMAVKTIRVFNGDLHTQVYMLSDDESRDAFGTNFARYFFVGKAYFRNRHTDKKLIVNTTSLRARTVFYREPVNGEDTNSWRRKLPWLDSDGSHKGDYSRYDYIVDSAAQSENTLSIGAEDAIFDVIRSRESIDKLRDARNSDVDVKKWVLDRVNATLALDSNKELKEASLEFIDFALGTTKNALSVCQPQQRNGALDDAELYVRAFAAVGEKVRPDVPSLARDLSSVTGMEKESAKKFVKCVADIQSNAATARTQAFSSASPATLDLRRRVGLTNKIAAASSDTYWQQRLSKHGYLWQDFYRPMTFEAVLLSLSAKTKSHPNNRIIEYLQSIGVIAGSLVGLGEISSRLASQGFAERVAVTTGVFVPEIKKLIMRDLDQYLTNLAATALPSILALAPNESRDGYVFFPRGAIYGYGVDEFSLNEPSYIVNIDNDDISVDGALIEGEVQFSAGQKTVDSQVQAARDQGRKQVSEDLTKLADLHARIFSYRLAHISNNVCEMIAAGKIDAAKQYLRFAKAADKAATESPLLVELEARANQGIACDKPLAEEKIKP